MEHSREYKRRVRKRILRRRLIIAAVCLFLAVAIALGVFSCSGKTSSVFSSPAETAASTIAKIDNILLEHSGKIPATEIEKISAAKDALIAACETADKAQIKAKNLAAEQEIANINALLEKALAQPYVVSTASVGSAGDILVHTPILWNAQKSDGSFDFTNIVPQVKSYMSAFDYMSVNLEVTCGGTEAGKYDGYPAFNIPDTILDAFKGAGVDMMLTANNHAYDTGAKGMLRTVKVLKEKGIDALGTRENIADKDYIVKDINGIKIGMVCYTYENESGTAGRKSINGRLMTAEASPLIKSFNYNNLPAFYADAANTFNEMKQDGAEAVIYYIHWGNEYQRTPNKYQKDIAQRLSDIGADVIVGGHPHVVQPFETLKGVNGNETVCIYSTGNFVSNQRIEAMDNQKTGHTEDGMIFGVTFQKWSDGKITLSDVNILPTWVNLKTVSGKRVYEIAPLDISVSDWTTFGLTGSKINKAKASYNRTMALVGEGLNNYRTSHGMSAVQTTIE